MLTIGVDVRALAGARFSVSPVMEAMAWVRLAATTRRHAVFGDPGPAARGALRHPEVALIVDLLPAEGGDYIPDLLTPQPGPGPWQRVLESQIAEIEAAAQDAVDSQAIAPAETHAGRPVSHRVRRLAESGRLQQRLAAGVARFWREAMRDDWPALQTILDNDMAARAKVAAAHGIGRMLDGIHPAVHWTGDQLVVDSRHDLKANLDGHCLVLAVTALNWPTLMWQAADGAPATLYYPAATVGDIDRRDPARLADVVGAVRAALLTDLAVARSTTELAGRHAVSPSTVSYHLGALHRARLVTKHRDGRHVMYQRTRLADPLIESSRPPRGLRRVPVVRPSGLTPD